mmetsp:Transcript_6688/g.24777  ORF Transcript_6688/g.24777 Transcript_6688/m.24777 type:complete len:374 (-) Transcript_6688:85-1206(-)
MGLLSAVGGLCLAGVALAGESAAATPAVIVRPIVASATTKPDSRNEFLPQSGSNMPSQELQSQQEQLQGDVLVNKLLEGEDATIPVSSITSVSSFSMSDATQAAQYDVPMEVFYGASVSSPIDSAPCNQQEGSATKTDVEAERPKINHRKLGSNEPRVDDDPAALTGSDTPNSQWEVLGEEPTRVGRQLAQVMRTDAAAKEEWVWGPVDDFKPDASVDAERKKMEQLLSKSPPGKLHGSQQLHSSGHNQHGAHPQAPTARHGAHQGSAELELVNNLGYFSDPFVQVSLLFVTCLAGFEVAKKFSRKPSLTATAQMHAPVSKAMKHVAQAEAAAYGHTARKPPKGAKSKGAKAKKVKKVSKEQEAMAVKLASTV